MAAEIADKECHPLGIGIQTGQVAEHIGVAAAGQILKRHVALQNKMVAGRNGEQRTVQRIDGPSSLGFELERIGKRLQSRNESRQIAQGERGRLEAAGKTYLMDKILQRGQAVVLHPDGIHLQVGAGQVDTEPRYLHALVVADDLHAQTVQFETGRLLLETHALDSRMNGVVP